MLRCLRVENITMRVYKTELELCPTLAFMNHDWTIIMILYMMSKLQIPTGPKVTISILTKHHAVTRPNVEIPSHSMHSIGRHILNTETMPAHGGMVDICGA